MRIRQIGWTRKIIVALCLWVLLAWIYLNFCFWPFQNLSMGNTASFLVFTKVAFSWVKDRKSVNLITHFFLVLRMDVVWTFLCSLYALVTWYYSLYIIESLAVIDNVVRKCVGCKWHVLHCPRIALSERDEICGEWVSSRDTVIYMIWQTLLVQSC